jgi:hypothetical protein
MDPTVRELNALRQLLDSLKSGSMAIHQNSVDVTQREIDRLKPDIEYLEGVFSHDQDEAMAWLA